MKTLSFTVPDEEAELLEVAARERGLALNDLLIEAAIAYLSARSMPPPDADETDGPVKPDHLWFIGIADGHERPVLNAGPPQSIEEEMARAIWHDSFGGTRPWIEEREGAQQSQPINDPAEPASS